MLKVEDIARELSISQMTVFRALNTGRIKGVKIGNIWRVSEEEVERIKKEGF